MECVEGMPYVFLGRTLDLTLLVGGGAGGRGDLMNFLTPFAERLDQYLVEEELVRDKAVG